MSMREDVEKCEEFLRELTRGIPSDQRAITGFASEATVQTDANGKKVNAPWWPRKWKEGDPLNYNSNAYVCISSSIKTPNPKTGEMRYWRGEASFGRGCAMMVDDIGNGKGSKGDFSIEEMEAKLPPTAIVETSPNNYQLWYFFDEPQDSMIQFKALLTCFVSAVLKKGGDNTIKDISRFGRMPLGFNNKREGDGQYKYLVDGKPFRVRLVSADYSRRYSPEQIARAFSFDIVIPAKRTVEFDGDEFKFDAVWLRIAERITDRAKMGEGSNGDVFQNMSGKYRIRCPWGHNHANGDPYGAYFRGPIAGADVEFVFGCGHDSCRKETPRTWAQFVDVIVMPVVYDLCQAANDKACGIVRHKS